MVMFERRMLKNLDWVLLVAVVLVVAFSLVVIASATHANLSERDDPYYFVKRQTFLFVIGVIGLFFTLAIDYHTIASQATYLYFTNLALLASVLLLGNEAKGAARWIEIGPFPLQPSEPAKIIIIITLANLVAKLIGDINKFTDLFPIFVHVGIPMLLIMIQPDLGTSLVFIAILMGVFFIAGIKWQFIFTIIGTGVAMVPVLWGFLKDYQQKRILVFLDPSIDPTGSGYHVIQSMIAIGSGRMTGQGLFAGPQNQLDFLPEQHTDFIFSVVGEELGFIGAVFLLVLYFIIIYRGIRIIGQARDLLGALIATGIVSLLTFQLLVNVGMTIGIMPVTGLPLPLVSYGGSSLLSTMIGIGLLLNVGMRRQKILF
jgi:rod shape determining protein RodA